MTFWRWQRLLILRNTLFWNDCSQRQHFIGNWLPKTTKSAILFKFCHSIIIVLNLFWHLSEQINAILKGLNNKYQLKIYFNSKNTICWPNLPINKSGWANNWTEISSFNFDKNDSSSDVSVIWWIRLIINYI